MLAGLFLSICHLYSITKLISSIDISLSTLKYKILSQQQ
jgi:hypothetical protein